MPKYEVKRALKFEGARREEGETVEMAAKDALPLISAGIVAPLKAQKAEEK